MTPRAAFGNPDDLPIPTDVSIGPGWTSQMIEMADHIGAYATLQICAGFGGEYLYIAIDPEKNRLRDAIGVDKAAIMSQVYGRERLHIPTAKAALRHARRRPVLERVRAGDLTVSDAARMLGSSQPYISHLVNNTDEGSGVPASGANAAQRETHQMDLFEG